MACRITCLTYTRSPSTGRLFCLPCEDRKSLCVSQHRITCVYHATAPQWVWLARPWRSGGDANQHRGSILVKQPVPKFALVTFAQHR